MIDACSVEVRDVFLNACYTPYAVDTGEVHGLITKHHCYVLGMG